MRECVYECFQALVHLSQNGYESVQMYRHCASGEVEHGPSMVSHVSHPPLGQSADAPVRLLLQLNTAGLMAP